MAKGEDKKKNQQTNQLAQPHDATFKKLFGEIDIARDVIEKNLSKEVLDLLDMNSLKKLDGKGSKIMTILEKREQRGIEKGREEGREYGKIETVKDFIN